MLEAGSSALDEFAAEERMLGERDHQAPQHEVLLDVLDGWPRLGPRRARDLWDHVSIAASTFTRTCERVSTAPADAWRPGRR